MTVAEGRERLRLLLGALPLAASCLAACSGAPSDQDIETAVARSWEQGANARRADAQELAAMGARFGRGAELSSELARSMGRPESRVATRHAAAADELDVEARHLSRLAVASFVDLNDAACVSAKPEPGFNCDVSITVRPPGGEHLTLGPGRVRLVQCERGWAVHD